MSFDIHKLLFAAGVPLDSNASDLYAKVTPVSTAILDRYNQVVKNVSTFTSQIDNCVWYDIPFAYSTWWDAKNI